jgi:hypothetical protein
VHRECVPQIVQTRLISCILARDADMVSQPQECIFQDTPLYRFTVLTSEERIRPVAALPRSTPVHVILDKHTQKLPIERNASGLVELRKSYCECGFFQIDVGTCEVERFAGAETRAVQQC